LKVLPVVLNLIDESETRRDLAERRETKFVFEATDVRTIRALLQGSTKRLVHNQPVSIVRSIYFDDVSLSACHANLDGLGSRRKLRLRWYDQMKPGLDCYLEIKWRENRVTGKHRMRIKSDTPIGELRYRQLYDELMAVVPERLVANVVQYNEPVVIVEYKREHFASVDGRLRSTIDYDLKYYDQMGKQAISMRFPQCKPDFIVLEGKTPVGSECELREMFYPLQLRAQRCSKYVHGCAMLGLVGY
jgi:hypothetical protein